MQESTNNNRNESQPQTQDQGESQDRPQPKVKVWKTHSVHQIWANAEYQRVDLDMNREGQGAPEAKVRLRARGFLVKTWDGSMQSAPSPKPKKPANAPVNIGL